MSLHCPINGTLDTIFNPKLVTWRGPATWYIVRVKAALEEKPAMVGCSQKIQPSSNCPRFSPS